MSGRVFGGRAAYRGTAKDVEESAAAREAAVTVGRGVTEVVTEAKVRLCFFSA
jgi:hypothetical protein